VVKQAVAEKMPGERISAQVPADSFPNVSVMSNEVASLGFDSDFQYSLELRLEGLERRGTASSGEHYNCLEPTPCDD
jgi:hypothetical protein